MLRLPPATLQVALDKERDRDIRQQNYNVQFLGNPGTGKTVVARTYAELLQEVGVLPGAAVVETSGAELANGGVSKLQDQLKQLDKGGVLFIDEAYQLEPQSSPLGRQVGGASRACCSGQPWHHDARLANRLHADSMPAMAIDLDQSCSGHSCQPAVRNLLTCHHHTTITTPSAAISRYLLPGCDAPTCLPCPQTQVLDALLPEMENKRGRLVVVVAGYAKHMEKLMAHNEGLPSRFPTTFTFQDYSDEQLTDIFKGMLAANKPAFRPADERHLRIACRRLGRQRGAVGFGNARAVRNLLLERSITRQSARVLAARAAGGQPDTLLLAREDLLGPRQLDVRSSRPLQQLRQLRGLPKVKESVETLLQLIGTNAELEEQERPLKDVCLNRVFLGTPGTGAAAAGAAPRCT
jgi:hypothetical protein